MRERVLVTGATGFIGTSLVKELIDRGYDVRAMVRSSSNTAGLKKLRCELVTANLMEANEDLVNAVDGCDKVFHLAAETRTVLSTDLVERNGRGMKNLIDAILKQKQRPRLVYVSSLAAAGPSTESEPLRESMPRCPGSWYGKSKAACEELAEAHADEISISIVRPPIVLGEDDRNGWLMFHPIDRFGIHFVPGFKTRLFSAIYVGDLCDALIQVAERGKALSKTDASKSDVSGQGIYYATSPEVYSFADLGRAIGKSMGKDRVYAIPIAMTLLWAVATFNEVKGRVLNRAQFLNRDKLTEASLGSWWCSGEKLKNELGFEPRFGLEDRLKTIVAGYRARGWLSAPKETGERRPATEHKAASREKSFG